MVVVMTASLDCILLELLFSLVESQGCEKSALFVCLFSTLTLQLLDYIGITLGVWSVRTETVVRRKIGTKMTMKNCKMPLLILPMTGNRMFVFAKPAGWFILESNCC